MTKTKSITLILIILILAISIFGFVYWLMKTAPETSTIIPEIEPTASGGGGGGTGNFIEEP